MSCFTCEHKRHPASGDRVHGAKYRLYSKENKSYNTNRKRTTKIRVMHACKCDLMIRKSESTPIV